MTSLLKILIAADHGGLDLKKNIVENLSKNKNITFEDVGCFSTDSVDYPDFAEKVALAVSNGEVDRGILVCGTGIGMAITANKFKGVRASIVNDLFSAQMTREHNDLNVLCLGGRVLDSKLAIEIVGLFLTTPFADGRHSKRLDKIRDIENRNFK